jgi:hypothetical protein
LRLLAKGHLSDGPVTRTSPFDGGLSVMTYLSERLGSEAPEQNLVSLLRITLRQ